MNNRPTQMLGMDYRDAKCNNSSMPNHQIKMAEEAFPTETDANVLLESPTDSLMTETKNKKILALRSQLEEDPRAADLKWSLFVAACNTYRYDSCLKPFPPMYITNECRDIEALREAIEAIPSLSVILKELQDATVCERYGSAIDLLHWVLVKMGDPCFKTVSKDSHNSVLSKVPSEISVPAPNLIFQVVSTNQSIAEQKWKQIAQEHSTFYAYHGSRLENFHSIIHYGWQQSMRNDALFGKGTYFSSELSISLLYSPTGYGWGGCMLGSKMSCVALCELIDHPDVKIGNSEQTSRCTFLVGGQEKVPNKYCLVTNNELVRVRYLLVYSQENQKTRCTDNRGLVGWFKQHKLLTFVIGYVVLLASVGLTHNKQVEKYYKLLVQKVGLE